jgi:hypothetical protein
MSRCPWIVWSVGLTLALSACAVLEEPKQEVGETGALDALRAQPAGAADSAAAWFRGSLAFGAQVEGDLSNVNPFEAWSVSAEAGDVIFVDLADRTGRRDLFVLLYRVLADGRLGLHAYNDDCYEGTLNACLEVELPTTGEWWIVASTYQYVAMGHTPRARYSLGLHCNSPDGVCGPEAAPGAGVGEMCGGIAGFQCQEGLECDVTEAGCGADLAGVCAPEASLICIALYDPVCGCDGVTYSNDCHRRNANVGLDHVGECRCDPGVDECLGLPSRMPNWLCEDGETVGGPACLRRVDDTCHWDIVSCPATE